MKLKMKEIAKTIRKQYRKKYSPKEIHSILFEKNHLYPMNWENPQTYDEKLRYAMVYCIGAKESKYADKIAVRDYVKECGYEQLLPKLYGVWNCVEDIELSKLPEKFALKTNHACGDAYYLLCKDKEAVSWKKEFKKFKKALKKTFWEENYEYHYKYIEPKVYAEELLENENSERMIDYKIFCFGGKPYCILVCSGREGKLKRDYYDTNWNPLDVCDEIYRSGKNIEKPLGLEIMLEAAGKISSKFPTARIDFYDVKGKVYFGEVTLTPGAGNLSYISDKYQKLMGEMFILPKNNVFTKD